MDSNISKKIEKLKILKALFLLATVFIGIITVIDIFLPDPIFLLDEAALASITGFFTYLANFVDKKIRSLQKEQRAQLNMNEVKDISNAFSSTVQEVKKSRKK